MAAEFESVEVVRKESLRCAATFKNNVWIPDNTKFCPKIRVSRTPKPEVKRVLGKVGMKSRVYMCTTCVLIYFTSLRISDMYVVMLYVIIVFLCE